MRYEHKGAHKLPSIENDPAFYSTHSLIVSDQGVRGFLQVVNDICYSLASKLELRSWVAKSSGQGVQDDAISAALSTLATHKAAECLVRIANGLAAFDWRTSAATDLSDPERIQKLAYRGSGGYRELRRQLLLHLSSNNDYVGTAAKKLIADS